ncbi:MAG: hypothetical protein MJ231_06880 [bacterium]|nr:hypothetical protein [bacterium]
MTVLPGSLDYLYYNGILDHIPYEAYDMSPIVGRNKNTSMANSFAQSSMNSVQSQMQQMQPIVQSNGMSSYGMQSNSAMMSSTGMYNSVNTMDYINSAKQGSLYNNNFSDMYMGNTYSQSLTGMKSDQPQYSNSIKDTITTTANNITGKFSGMSPIGKGLIGLGTVILTAIMIVKGGKKCKVKKGAVKNKSFWSKLNPKNWGKKAQAQQPPQNTKKTFWQKLGFGKTK